MFYILKNIFQALLTDCFSFTHSFHLKSYFLSISTKSYFRSQNQDRILYWVDPSRNWMSHF